MWVRSHKLSVGQRKKMKKRRDCKARKMCVKQAHRGSTQGKLKKKNKIGQMVNKFVYK